VTYKEGNQENVSALPDHFPLDFKAGLSHSLQLNSSGNGLQHTPAIFDKHYRSGQPSVSKLSPHKKESHTLSLNRNVGILCKEPSLDSLAFSKTG
jgi:hypothetical protein